MTQNETENVDASNNGSVLDEKYKDFLYVKRMGIDTHQEPVVYMRKDCHV